MKSVRIFSNPHRQLEKTKFGSPSARARLPILSAKLNFLSLFCEAEMKQNSNYIIIIPIIWFILFMLVAQLFTPAEKCFLNMLKAWIKKIDLVACY